MAYSYLENIKKMLGITGSYQDDILDGYAEEAIAYMVDAGIDEDTARGEKAVGVVARGVSDLWNYGSGEAHLSDYFRERVVQLSYKVKNNPDPGDEEEGTLRLIVTITEKVDEDTQTEKITADKTYEEIKSAWDSGREVVAIISHNGYTAVFRIEGMTSDAIYFGTYISFTGNTYGIGYNNHVVFVVNSSNQWIIY